MDESAWIELQNGARQLSLPASVTLTSAEGAMTICAERALRLLPGKRVTVRGVIQGGELDGRGVALKLFLRRQRGERHRQRELAGHQRLRSAGVACPELLASGISPCGELVGVVYQWVDHALPLGQCWQQFDPAQKRMWLQRVVAEVLRLHRHGAWQQDIHLDNFLVAGERLITLDLATVAATRGVQPLPMRRSLANLGQLAAQLEVADQPLLMAAVREAFSHKGTESPARLETRLWRATRYAWRKRLRDYLEKSMRDCSLTHVERGFDYLWCCRRERWGDDARRFAVDPESFMAEGELLKAGNTATVVRTVLDGRPVIIKRYNIKNWRHAVSRAIRPSRASHSWRYAHLLELVGLPATGPVALLERRWGPLRRRAYFICDAIDAPDLLGIGEQRGLTPSECSALSSVLELMLACQLSHGDFKANNLLVGGDRIWLIDLDAMHRHRSPRSFQRAFRRDLARLRRNWPAAAEISGQVERLIEQLPASGRRLWGSGFEQRSEPIEGKTES